MRLGDIMHVLNVLPSPFTKGAPFSLLYVSWCFEKNMATGAHPFESGMSTHILMRETPTPEGDCHVTHFFNGSLTVASTVWAPISTNYSASTGLPLVTKGTLPFYDVVIVAVCSRQALAPPGARHFSQMLNV